MNRIYYSQIDSRWKNHPYPANAAGYRDKTIGTSGCGVTCGAMIISSCKETIYPDAMGDLSRKNGYRVAGGTADGFFPFIAEKWGIEYKRLKSSFEAHEYCKKGWFVVICCGSGLWTTGGHFILAVNANDTDICIYDPYLYNGKFDRSGRAGIVNLKGTAAWVEINKFKAKSNAQRFFAFNVGAIKTPAPTNNNDTTSTKTRYVTASVLNVRKGPGTNNSIVGTLKNGTKVTVYEEKSGWSRIGTNKWVSNSYLSSSKPKESTTKMYVNTNSANLNVRKIANGTIIGELKKGTAVEVVKTENGWSKIISPKEGWVSAKYLSKSKPNVIKSTVGQTKILKSTTTLYSKSNLSGTKYTYKPNTAVVIQLNVSSTVDKIRVPATGRVAYCRNNVYK